MQNVCEAQLLLVGAKPCRRISRRKPGAPLLPLKTYAHASCLSLMPPPILQVVVRLHSFCARVRQKAAAASGSGQQPAPTLSITLAAARLFVTADGKTRDVKLQPVGRWVLCSCLHCIFVVSLMTPCSPCAQHRAVRGIFSAADRRCGFGVGRHEHRLPYSSESRRFAKPPIWVCRGALGLTIEENCQTLGTPRPPCLPEQFPQAPCSVQDQEAR